MTLSPTEMVVSVANYQALQAKLATLEAAPPVAASCSSVASRLTNLNKQLAAARAGDPGYEKLEAKVSELQSRLSQSQQRESELHKKLNELIQIERGAHLGPGS